MPTPQGDITSSNIWSNQEQETVEETTEEEVADED
jgi:hypothetical protein